MNDLPEAIKSSRSSSIESSVDDKKIYLPFSTKDLDSCLRLVAEDLHHVAEWCCANHLLFLCLSWVKDLTPVSSGKGLGAKVDSNLTLNVHVS